MVDSSTNPLPLLSFTCSASSSTCLLTMKLVPAQSLVWRVFTRAAPGRLKSGNNVMPSVPHGSGCDASDHDVATQVNGFVWEPTNHVFPSQIMRALRSVP